MAAMVMRLVAEVETFVAAMMLAAFAVVMTSAAGQSRLRERNYHRNSAAEEYA